MANIFSYVNHFAEKLGATAEWQLASTNLQPTNLLSKNYSVNSNMTVTRVV